MNTNTDSTEIQLPPLVNGQRWLDDKGQHINAHGGGILRDGARFYWYGEHKTGGTAGNLAWVGVHVYSSEDLINWRDDGIAFDLRQNEGEVKAGCVLERPKVLRSPATGKYVMWFHFEYDKSYSDAMLGVAVADAPTGPFRLLGVRRPNPGIWPENVTPELQDPAVIYATMAEYSHLATCANPLTPRLSVLGMDFETGQQSRDMTLFADDDGQGYLLYSSEKNSTLHIAALTPDYTDFNGRYHRAFPWRWMEAPVIFKRGGKYYLIASDCTGWAPNAARSAVADHPFGPWRELGNPAVGDGADTTFGAQGCFALKLSEERIIFMADRWNPENAINGRYLWLEVEWEGERPVLRDTPNAPSLLN